ncbi:MAG: hypothetical protein KIS92_01030 [Planctomycetota bacterium]|nr:hypothetical protein [Planctomycetota bacterium]
MAEAVGLQMEQKTVSKTKARALIVGMQKKKGEVFYVKFVKRENNEVRDMRCAFGIKDNLKGKGQNFDPKKLHLVTVYDMDKSEYRMVSLERLLEIRIGATIYKVAKPAAPKPKATKAKK